MGGASGHPSAASTCATSSTSIMERHHQPVRRVSGRHLLSTATTGDACQALAEHLPRHPLRPDARTDRRALHGKRRCKNPRSRLGCLTPPTYISELPEALFPDLPGSRLRLPLPRGHPLPRSSANTTSDCSAPSACAGVPTCRTSNATPPTRPVPRIPARLLRLHPPGTTWTPSSAKHRRPLRSLTLAQHLDRV